MSEKWINVHINEIERMKNGLYAEIKGGLYFKLVVQFEDGEKVTTNYDAFRTGKVDHKKLSINNKNHASGTLSSFTITKFSFRNTKTGEVYYECKCRDCGEEGILTPQEMLIHKCEKETYNVINEEPYK